MDSQNHLQELQDRCRTSRSTSGVSRSISRTTFELIQKVLATKTDDRPSDRPSDRTYPYQAGTHIPHPLCRESYHLGSHFGAIWGRIGWVFGGFKMVFLCFWGVLKFAKNSPIKPVLGSVGTGSLHCPFGTMERPRAQRSTSWDKYKDYTPMLELWTACTSTL